MPVEAVRVGRARKQREALWESGRCGKRPGFEWQEYVCVGEPAAGPAGLLCTRYQATEGAWGLGKPRGTGCGSIQRAGVIGASLGYHCCHATE